MISTKTRGDPKSGNPQHLGPLRQLLQSYYEGRDRLRRGLCLLAAGRYDQAICELNAAAQANPDSLSLPTYLAAAYVGRGHFKAAADELQEIVNREPADVRNRIRHALALWKAGQADRAVASLRDGIRRTPDSAELHFQLATILASAGETEEAELRFTQAAAIDKHHTDALVGLALCHGAQGNAAKAVSLLKRAQAQNPRNARVALLLTYALEAAKHTHRMPVQPAMPDESPTEDEPALEELSAIIETEPDFVEAFLSLDAEDVDGDVFTMLAATINRALERSPEHADLHYHSGRVLDRLGRTGDAIAAVERAVELRPVFIKALIQLAKLYQRSDRRLDACRRLEETIRLGAKYADVYYMLGNLYRDGGMTDRAREAYRHALGINPHYAAAQHAMQAVSV